MQAKYRRSVLSPPSVRPPAETHLHDTLLISTRQLKLLVCSGMSFLLHSTLRRFWSNFVQQIIPQYAINLSLVQLSHFLTESRIISNWRHKQTDGLPWIMPFLWAAGELPCCRLSQPQTNPCQPPCPSASTTSFRSVPVIPMLCASI